MSLAEEICREHDLLARGTDLPKENAVSAIDAALERAAQECDKFATEPHETAMQIGGDVCAQRIRALKSRANERANQEIRALTEVTRTPAHGKGVSTIRRHILDAPPIHPAP